MNNQVRRYPQIGLIYSHYKGGMYEPLFVSTHSETGEELINYKSIHFGTYHSRPLEMWFDKVEIELDNGDKGLVSRFYPHGQVESIQLLP